MERAPYSLGMANHVTNLARLIDERGLRKDYIAARVGVSKSAMSRWCSGERRIPAERLGAIAAVLGVQAEEIVEEGVGVA